LQSLKEIDRYRDSAQRKAVINSILALFIKKDADKMGTLPVTGGARRKDSVTVVDGDGETRTRRFIDQVPGMVLEELQTGEEPVGFHNQGTDDRFGVFEEAIIQAVAWANEIPPEILRLSFSNNYAASQAAINEFKIYLNKVWSDWGETFCAPIWIDWLLSETLARKVKAPGLLDAWRSPTKVDAFGAWVAADWYGSIKPSTDMVKQVKGSGMLIDRALSTHAREARNITGTRWTRNIKKLKRENEQIVEAQRPLAEFKREFGEQPDDPVGAAALDALESFVDEYLESRGVGDESG
jgi:capsid protein